jgi:hypothetical protein
MEKLLSLAKFEIFYPLIGRSVSKAVTIKSGADYTTDDYCHFLHAAKFLFSSKRNKANALRGLASGLEAKPEQFSNLFNPSAKPLIDMAVNWLNSKDVELSSAAHFFFAKSMERMIPNDCVYADTKIKNTWQSARRPDLDRTYQLLQQKTQT